MGKKKRNPMIHINFSSLRKAEELTSTINIAIDKNIEINVKLRKRSERDE